MSPAIGQSPSVAQQRDRQEVEVLMRSRVPLVVIETHEEVRATDMVVEVGLALKRPVYRWSVTEGIRRADLLPSDLRLQTEPAEVLRHVRTLRKPSVVVLADFHPYLSDPTITRLIKEIALDHDQGRHTLVFVSHEFRAPPELIPFVAPLRLALPDRPALEKVVRQVAVDWTREAGSRVRTDARALELLVDNLAGLTERDARRLARNAIFDDGAITAADVPNVMRAKYALLNRGGVLHYEFDVARLSDVGGFAALKRWLQTRHAAFLRRPDAAHLDAPKGVLLLGVQGCGKSLAAKAAAGTWGVPLLRLDFGALYNKYIGETERNLRESLQAAEAMAPCVLWVDELEKGISSDSADAGTSARVLGALLTWMAEKRAPVFVVATANDIGELPPELVRKGRFDEIFFVDLPDARVRQSILAIHLARRGASPEAFDLPGLAAACEGFSGAELEQAVVSGHYAAHADAAALDSARLHRELERTRPLSVVMAERIAALRAWARDRTVSCE